MKTTIITMLLLAAGICAVAQEKWEYAVVYTVNFKTVVVNASNIERITTEKGIDLEVAVLQKVQSMNNEGWEVYNTAPTFFAEGAVRGHVYYLRKKVKG